MYEIIETDYTMNKKMVEVVKKNKEKILITGTGRSGTTFLIKLFTFLEYDTGFTKQNYMNDVEKKSNSGMEKSIDENFYILKNPTFMEKIKNIMESKHNIKLVIIPIRKYEESAASRKKHGNGNGGLWKAKTYKEQISFYHKIMAEYMLYMTKYNIKTIFLDFDKMVSDKQYLYEALSEILKEKNISLNKFSRVYDEVSKTAKPK